MPSNKKPTKPDAVDPIQAVDKTEQVARQPKSQKAAKTSKTNKTAHVLSLLTDTETAATQPSPPEPEETAAQAAPAQVLSGVEVVRNTDEALSDQIRDALERDLQLSEAPPAGEALLGELLAEAADDEAETPDEADEPEDEAPEAEYDEAESDEDAQPDREEAHGEEMALQEEKPRAPKSGRTGFYYTGEGDNASDIYCVNVMQALVEEKVDKYIKLFGLCDCPRCRIDVIALALSKLPSKYVVVQGDDAIPMLTVYEGNFSASVTAQVMWACKRVADSPRHAK